MPPRRSILKNVLNPMLPFKMLLRLYSFGVLMVDILWAALVVAFATLGHFLQCLKPLPVKSVEGEVLMVVGTGKGVGKDIAIQMAARGAKILCVDHNEDNNAKTVAFINKKKGIAHSYTCDVTKKENVDSMVAQIKKDEHVVTMLFYCCGLPSARSVMEQPIENVSATLDVTLTGFIWLIKKFLPEMKEKNHGHIVALSSVAGLSQLKEPMALTSAQFGVQGLAASLLENLRVNKVNGVHVSLIHVYPFIMEQSSELRLAIPGYFGTMTPSDAAQYIIDIVLSNIVESSIPKRLLLLGRLLRLLPRNAIVHIRDFLDTGVDFA